MLWATAASVVVMAITAKATPFGRTEGKVTRWPGAMPIDGWNATAAY